MARLLFFFVLLIVLLGMLFVQLMAYYFVRVWFKNGECLIGEIEKLDWEKGIGCLFYCSNFDFEFQFFNIVDINKIIFMEDKLECCYLSWFV